MSSFKAVSKDEFFDFLTKYPSRNSLSVGTTTICEPPIRHYHDHSLPTKGVRGSADFFFDTEVARVVMSWLGPAGQLSKGEEFYEYKIKEDS